MMTSTVSSMSAEVLMKLREYDSPLSSLRVAVSHSSPESDQTTLSDESMRTRLWVWTPAFRTDVLNEQPTSVMTSSSPMSSMNRFSVRS